MLRSHRAAAGDPYARDVRADHALVVRLGYGEGDQVADGRFGRAVELPKGPPKRKRGEALAPQERLAAILGGRDTLLVGEELLLRAQLDLDAGRTREAALQARVALESLLGELDEKFAAPLRPLRDQVARAANAALDGELSAERRGRRRGRRRADGRRREAQRHGRRRRLDQTGRRAYARWTDRALPSAVSLRGGGLLLATPSRPRASAATMKIKAPSQVATREFPVVTNGTAKKNREFFLSVIYHNDDQGTCGADVYEELNTKATYVVHYQYPVTTRERKVRLRSRKIFGGMSSPASSAAT